MKKLVLALVAPVLVPAAASADVLGVRLQDGWTVRYSHAYEHDNGQVEIHACTVVVKDDRGVVVAPSPFQVDLTVDAFHCGGARRNKAVTYRAFVEFDSGYTDRGCFDVDSGRSVDSTYCGF